MSLYNSYDRTAFLGELASPLDTQLGVLTPAQQRNKVLNNLYGNAFNDGTVLVGALTSANVGDKLVTVPNVASGGVLAVHTTQTISHSIRIKSADGTLYYVMLTNVVTNRTGGA